MNTIEAVNSFLTRIKRSQRVVPKGDFVKVNFGSSLFVQEGWINVEGSLHSFFAKWPAIFPKVIYRFSRASDWYGTEDKYLRVLRTNTFIHHDLDYGLPFTDNSVDFLYASHILEHFYPDVAAHILKDAYRVLKKGGRIRICVPDLRHAVDVYLSGQTERALKWFFKSSRPGKFYHHKYMYDFELLKSKLEMAGFTSIERCTYQQGKVPDIEKLDNRPEETLYVEAVKGAEAPCVAIDAGSRSQMAHATEYSQHPS